MFGNYRKIEKRILSLLLVFSLTVSLLSRCGQNKGEEAKDYSVWEEAKEERAEKEQELVEAKNEHEKLVVSLEDTIERNNCDEAQAIIEELANQLEETDSKTQEWIASQNELTQVLDDEASKLLIKRKNAFLKELEEVNKTATKLLEEIENVLNESKIDEAAQKTEKLKTLLIEEEEPQTYGTSLPSEVDTKESEKAAYEEETEETRESEVVEQSSEKLLTTKEDTELSDEIIELSEELGTPLAVYNYVKNNIGYEYYSGSRKGAAGTLDSYGGNDIDQASLLIAMLRHQGYEAEYVKGDILLTPEQAISLTGAIDGKQAADILASAGVPVTRLTKGEEIVYIRMEHVWVRANIPYTDYRGSGNEAGDKVWIELDTSIKEYEAVTNIYDTLDEKGFSEEIKSITESGDTSQLESLISEWEDKLGSEDFSETYARKRIIKQEEVSYLPLSLQYRVEREIDTFDQVPDSYKDIVSFEINDEVLGNFKASELQGKDVLLSYKPASKSDESIYNSYNSIFDIPAYAVYMTPVLLVDGKEVARGEEYLETTLGTKSSFTIQLSSGKKNTSITNEVTTGSMYAVTLDSQSITGNELQSIYDEVAALKESVDEENVYSEAYLGKLLNLAGKLYYAQVDIADMMASDIYNVASTRSLSEGITGYEVETTGLYGMVTGVTEGSLYIDIDNDSHSVVSLEGNSDVTREYFLATGMMSSLYESTVWEEITGEESVSTIAILAKASEENIDILLLSKANLSEEIEKLHTDETTKQSIVNAVNSGMIVTVPAQEVTIGDWNGTGYIVTNPATGVGNYMISGGLNGGSVSISITLAYIVDIIACIIDFSQAILMIAGAIEAMIVAVTIGSMSIAVVALVLGIVLAGLALANYIHTISLMCDYVLGDMEAGQELISDAWLNVIFGVVSILGSSAVSNALENSLKNSLIRKYGTEFVENMLKEFGNIQDLSRCIKQLEKQKLSIGTILEIAEKYGKEGLEWFLAKAKLGITDDLVRLLLKLDDLSGLTDDVIRAIINSNGYAEDIINYIARYGDDAIRAIGTYGDDAVNVIRQYGDNAVDGFKEGRTPSQIVSDLNLNYPITLSINGKTISLNEAKDVWSLDALTRGKVIEELLARSEYVYWWHCGAENGGYFPVVDFQKGTKVVSLKSIDPSLKTYSGGKGTNKILEYIDALNVDITISGKPAERILDVRVPKGTKRFLDTKLIEKEANKNHIICNIREFG